MNWVLFMLFMLWLCLSMLFLPFVGAGSARPDWVNLEPLSMRDARHACMHLIGNLRTRPGNLARCTGIRTNTYSNMEWKIEYGMVRTDEEGL